MDGAERVSRYTALDRQEAFDIEYWSLEEAKLARLPPPKPLDGQIVVVVGAGSGIGRALVDPLIALGATVAAIDLQPPPVGLGLSADITDRAAVRRALDAVTLAYGGIDHVVVTAGYYPTPADAEWAKTFAVNVTGPYFVADECFSLWQAQGLPGTLVLTTSVNAVVPKAGTFAYDTSKAAANHLVRELAVAFAPLVRVNAVAPATVLEGSSMFPRDRVIHSLRKYNLPADDAESTDALRDRLATYYAARTLTGQPVTLDAQVKAILAFVTDTFTRTTGQIVNVDGGLAGAFLR
jgi:NAD(P)-dependent dehydrogenase (short-subunit alcohol dehydrogenase family)